MLYPALILSYNEPSTNLSEIGWIIMRLEQLHYLVALAKHRSLNAASESLYITQQSLGKAIRDLETELGVPLISRSPKGIVLTAEGQEAVSMAQDLLEQVGAFTHHFQPAKAQDQQQGSLLILCCQAAYPQILPAVIWAFNQKHPHVQIMTMERDGLYIPSLHLQLSQEKPDMDLISIINLPAPEEYPGLQLPEALEFVPLLPNHWLALVSRRSPLAKMKKISMKTLLKEPIIMQSPDYPNISSSCIDHYLFSRFGTPQVKMIVDSLDLYCQAIENNAGVSMTSSIYANIDRLKHSQELVCIPIKEKQTVTLGYFIEPAKPLSPIVQEFITTMTEVLKDFRCLT